MPTIAVWRVTSRMLGRLAGPRGRPRPRRPERGEADLAALSPDAGCPPRWRGRGVDRSQLVRDYPSRQLGLASPGRDRQRLRFLEPRRSSWELLAPNKDRY